MSFEQSSIQQATDTTHVRPTPPDCQLQQECRQLLNTVAIQTKKGEAGNAEPKFGEADPVINDLVHGAASQLLHHPFQVGQNAIFGLGLAASAHVFGPELGTVAGLGMLGLAAWNTSGHLRRWLDAAHTVKHPESASPFALTLAHKELRSLGADLTDTTAGIIGGGSTFRGLSILKAKSIIDSKTKLPPPWL